MANSSSLRLVVTTVPDDITASKIADTIVMERLAACVTVGSAVHSVFFWEGKLEKSKEYPVLIKTTRNAYKKLEERLIELHPYDVPEIISFNAEKVYQPYLSWLTENVDSSN